MTQIVEFVQRAMHVYLSVHLIDELILIGVLHEGAAVAANVFNDVADVDKPCYDI